MISLDYKYLRFLLYFLFIYLPFYSFIRGLSLLFLPSFFTSFLNITRDLLFIILIIFSFKIKKGTNYKINYLNLAIVLLLSVNIFSFIITLVRGHLYIAFQGFHLSVFPIFMFFAANKMQNKKLNIHLYVTKMFLNVGLLVSLISCLFYFFRPNIYVNVFNKIYINEVHSGEIAYSYARMMGTFFSPNVFGNFMATLSVLSYQKLLNSNRNKFYYTLIFIISFFNLMLSFSRGSWLFFIVCVLIIFFSNLKFFFIQIKYLVSLFVIVYITITSFQYSDKINLTDVFKMRFETVVNKKSDTYDRFKNINLVFNTMDKNPLVYLFGNGLGAGSQASTGQDYYIKDIGFNVVDSNFLKFFAESGLIGIVIYFISFTLIIIGLFRKIIFFGSKSLCPQKHKYDFIFFTILVLIGNLFQSIGSNPFDFISTAPFIWIFVGISSDL